MVMMHLGNVERVYSIELGTFFAHMRRRQLTTRNLAIDSNGLMRDPMCHRDLWKGTKSYFMAFVRWFKYKAQGKPSEIYAIVLIRRGTNINGNTLKCTGVSPNF